MGLLHLLGGPANLVRGQHDGLGMLVSVRGRDTGTKLLVLHHVNHGAVLAVVHQGHGDPLRSFSDSGAELEVIIGGEKVLVKKSDPWGK